MSPPSSSRSGTESLWSERPPDLLFPGIDNLHHLRFLATLMGSVHVKRLGIVIDEFPYCAMRHLSASRFRVLPLQCDGLSIRAGRAFHRKDSGAHGIHPCRNVSLAKVVVCGDSNPGVGLSHHVATEFLLEKAPIQQHLHFHRSGRFHRWLAGLHPLPGLSRPASRKVRKLLVRLAWCRQLLIGLHHRLLVHLFVRFFGDGNGCQQHNTESRESKLYNTHVVLLSPRWFVHVLEL